MFAEILEDSPKIPFMYNDIKVLGKDLLGLVVKAAVIEGKSGKQLKELDVVESSNLFSLLEVNLGFYARDIIGKLKAADVASTSQISDF